MESRLADVGRRLDELAAAMVGVGGRAVEVADAAGTRAEARGLTRDADSLARELASSRAAVYEAFEETRRAVSAYADSVEERLTLLRRELEAAEPTRGRG